MVNVTVYLKQGNKLSFKSEYLNLSRDICGQLNRLEWKNIPNEINVSYINLREVAAITTTTATITKEEPRLSQ